MKRTILVTILLAATAATATADVKIAVVDLNGALNESKAGKAALADVTAKGEKKQKELAAQRNELKKADDDLAKQAAVLKPDVLQKKRQELALKVDAFQQAALKAQKELEEMQLKAIDAIEPKLEKAVATVASRDNYDLVLRKEMVVWAKNPAIDITAAVVVEVDKAK